MTRATTVRAIYKCLLRDARELQRTPHFCLRAPLRLEDWGVGQFLDPTRGATNRDLTPAAADEAAPIRGFMDYERWRRQGFRGPRAHHGVDVVDVIRQVFRDNKDLADEQLIEQKLDEAIMTLHEISEQILLAKCSSVTVTDGVRIEVTSQYVQTHSNPENNVFRFTYRVTITNENEHTAVQILGRQYTFESEKGQRIALPRNSPGIVGNTPVLAPGDTFVYASGVDIDSPRGFVTGCLHALRRPGDPDHEELFDAFVSKFELLAPPAANSSA